MNPSSTLVPDGLNSIYVTFNSTLDGLRPDALSISSAIAKIQNLVSKVSNRCLIENLVLAQTILSEIKISYLHDNFGSVLEKIRNLMKFYCQSHLIPLNIFRFNICFSYLQRSDLYHLTLVRKGLGYLPSAGFTYRTFYQIKERSKITYKRADVHLYLQKWFEHQSTLQPSISLRPLKAPKREFLPPDPLEEKTAPPSSPLFKHLKFDCPFTPDFDVTYPISDWELTSLHWSEEFMSNKKDWSTTHTEIDEKLDQAITHTCILLICRIEQERMHPLNLLKLNSKWHAFNQEIDSLDEQDEELRNLVGRMTFPTVHPIEFIKMFISITDTLNETCCIDLLLKKKMRDITAYLTATSSTWSKAELLFWFSFYLTGKCRARHDPYLRTTPKFFLEIRDEKFIRFLIELIALKIEEFNSRELTHILRLVYKERFLIKKRREPSLKLIKRELDVIAEKILKQINFKIQALSPRDHLNILSIQEKFTSPIFTEDLHQKLICNFLLHLAGLEFSHWAPNSINIEHLSKINAYYKTFRRLRGFTSLTLDEKAFFLNFSRHVFISLNKMDLVNIHHVLPFLYTIINFYASLGIKDEMLFEAICKKMIDGRRFWHIEFQLGAKTEFTLALDGFFKLQFNCSAYLYVLLEEYSKKIDDNSLAIKEIIIAFAKNKLPLLPGYKELFCDIPFFRDFILEDNIRDCVDLIWAIARLEVPNKQIFSIDNRPLLRHQCHFDKLRQYEPEQWVSFTTKEKEDIVENRMGLKHPLSSNLPYLEFYDSE